MPDFNLDNYIFDDDNSRQNNISLDNYVFDDDVTANNTNPANPFTSTDAILAGLDFNLFGFADEASGLSGGLKALMKGESYLPAYQQNRDKVRQRLAEAMTNYPAKYMAAGAASTLVNPLTYLTGGGSAALQNAAKLGIYGKLAKAAKTGAKMGTVYGYGSGEGGVAERLGSAAIGGGAGAVGGAGLQGLASGAGKAITSLATSPTAQKVIYAIEMMAKALTRPATGELGAVGVGRAVEGTIPNVPAPLSKAENLLVKKIAGANTPVQTVDQAEIALAQALSDDVPLYLGEALESPQLMRYGRLIANINPSMETAQKAIAERKAGNMSRIKNVLTTVSPEDSALSGAQKFVTGAENVLGDAVAKRKKLTSGIYRQAFKETKEVEGKEVLKLLEKPRMKKAVKSVKTELPELADLPDNNLEILHEARQFLNDQTSNALREGNPRLAKLIGNVKQELDDILLGTDEKAGKAPAYIEATNLYAKASKLVDKLKGNEWGAKKTYGLIEDFLGEDGTKAVKATRELLKDTGLEPEDIRKLRSLFGTKYKDNFRAGIRAFIQDEVERQGVRKTFDRWIGEGTKRNAKLKAALGTDDYNKLAAQLKRESLIREGNQAYFEGSSTFGNAQESMQHNALVNALSGAWDVLRSPTTAPAKAFSWLDKAMSANPDPDVANDLARALFNTQGGLETLQRIKPVIARNAAINQAVNKASTAVGQKGSTPLAESLGSTTKKKVNKPTQLGIALGGTSMIDALPPKQAIATEDKKPTPSLLNAIKQVESAGKADAVSNKGAKGAYQFMPATGKEYHKRLGLTSPYNPEDEKQQRKLATAFLTDLLSKYEDERLAIAGYNYGEPRLDELIALYGNTWEDVAQHLPEETRNYVPKVLKQLKG